MSLPAMQETPVGFLGHQKIPWRRDRLPTSVFLGFPGGSVSKKLARNAGDLGSIPGLGRSPGGGHGHPLQYSCLGNPHGQRGLVGCSPWGHKESDATKHSTAKHKNCIHGFVGSSAVTNLSSVWEMQVQSLGQKDPPEEKMVTYSSILAWRIPWTEEPGGLQFIGSQKSHTRLNDWIQHNCKGFIPVSARSLSLSLF